MTITNDRHSVTVTVSLFGSIGAAVQAGLLIFQGKAFCLNEGCRIIEGLTRVQPQFINIAGAGFFLVTTFLASRASRSKFATDLLGLLLLAGIAAKGGLLGYQDFVAKTFCSWCLVVFTLVVLLNFLAGFQQSLRAVVSVVRLENCNTI